MKAKAEVVIIGAGIMGASLAYFLAKKGKDVLLLEKNEIGSGTSSATAAWLWPSDKRPEHYGRLAKASYERYMSLEEELGADFELTINGSLDIARTPEEWEGLQDLYEYDLRMGYRARLLSPQELAREEPAIRRDALGGLLVESDGHINPFLLIDGYVQAAKRLGAEVCTYTEVQDFVLEGNRIAKIITNRGSVEPELVICAAGIYSRAIGKMLGLEAHVYPERGFCLVSEKLPPVLNHTVCGARQTTSGNIVFGFIADKVDIDCIDRRMYMRGLRWAANDAVRDFPALSDVNIIRSYTGIRCKPEDKFPIVGPTETISNFWFHLAHSAFAINAALSPAVAELVTGERTMDSMPEYAYTRFEKQQ